MHEQYSHHFEKKMVSINAGEYYVSDSNEIISTLLGSCIAICLHDTEKGIAGMNHFMLPGRVLVGNYKLSNSDKYGINAIDTLLSTMEKRGSLRKNITAKIFGGGSVMECMKDSTMKIPFDNVSHAFMLIEMEDIPIIQSDTGGQFTRKVYMDVKSGKVYLKKSTSVVDIQKVVTAEIQHRITLPV